MVDKFTNIVRSRLYKKGYLGFTKQQYIDCAIALEVEDINNPSKEELVKAVDYLIDKQSSNLSSFEKDELLIDETSQQLEEAALTITEKQELVQHQSEAMGITLSEQDVIAIASNSDEQIVSGVAFLQEAKELITQYLANQVNNYLRQSNQLLGDINGAVNNAQSQISQIDKGINQGLTQILGGVASTAESRKSANKATLARLRAALNSGN